MKYLLGFSRLFVGSLFIVSGLIKANDPLGFSYKLGEYFAESALNLPFLEPWALALAVAACLAEIVLGFAVLFGAKIPLATWSLLILTLFFGWLTAYTATCDTSGTYTIIENGVEVVKSVTCVTDCGCFGDAMKGSIGRSLTPWESFSKDMILLVFILPIFFFQRKIKPNTFNQDKLFFPLTLLFIAFFSWIFGWYFPIVFAVIGYGGFLAARQLLTLEKSEWPTATWVFVIALAFAYWCISHLPVKDYRPYAEGKSISEGMKSADELGLEGPKYGYIYTLVNIESGEQKEMTDKEYIDGKWWENKAYEMNSDLTNQVKLKDGYEPPIHDFFIMDEEGNDKTPELLNAPKAFVLVAYDISKTSEAPLKELADLASAAQANSVMFVGLTASSYTEINALRHKHQLAFDFWNGDAIMLKTVIRSNPGLVYLENGTVVKKWHYNDLPSVEELENL